MRGIVKSQFKTADIVHELRKLFDQFKFVAVDKRIEPRPVKIVKQFLPQSVIRSGKHIEPFLFKRFGISVFKDRIKRGTDFYLFSAAFVQSGYVARSNVISVDAVKQAETFFHCKSIFAGRVFKRRLYLIAGSVEIVAKRDSVRIIGNTVVEFQFDGMVSRFFMTDLHNAVGDRSYGDNDRNDKKDEPNLGLPIF